MVEGTGVEPSRGENGAGPYAGERLGLPREGPMSIAPLSRRLIAVVADWLLCILVSDRISAWWGFDGGLEDLFVLVVFFVENVLLVSLVGSTIGHGLLGLRVGALGRSSLAPRQALVRSALLILFVPAVVFDKDGRGLHDRLAGTVIVRR